MDNIHEREEGPEKIREYEDDTVRREDAQTGREAARKQVLLRLSPGLWEKIAAWADDDFRSINGQIEFVLNEAVKKRSK